MYQYHQYEYSDYYNAEGKQVAGIQNKVNSIINANYNVPSYIGEFCLMSNTEAWSQGLKILNEAGLNWTTWTFKGISTGTTAGQNWCQYFLEDGSKVDVTSMSYEDLTSKKAYTDKKAGKKTVYYKVRAFRDAGGKKVYGKFSKVIKRTVKK